MGLHFFLKSQHSQILVIEHDSEFWPVSWTWSDVTVSPRVLSLIFFVCTYGGVSGGKFSLLHFQTNRGNSLIQTFLGTYVDGWYLLNYQIFTFADGLKIKSFSNRGNSFIQSFFYLFRDCYTGASYLNLCIKWHTQGAQNCSIHVIKLQQSEQSQFCECTPTCCHPIGCVHKQRKASKSH